MQAEVQSLTVVHIFAFFVLALYIAQCLYRGYFCWSLINWTELQWH